MTISEIGNWCRENTLLFITILVALAIIFITIYNFFKLIYDCHRAKLKLAPPRFAHGIILGKAFGLYIYSPEKAQEHAVGTGGSGSGKTSAMGLPSLRSWRTGQIWALDISGDISSNVHKPNTLICEPLADRTTPYDVFHSVDKRETRIEKNEALINLAYALLPEKATTDNAAYFESRGRDIIIASFIAFYYVGIDFTEICNKVVSTDYVTLFNEIDKLENPDASSRLTQFVGGNEKNTSGCKQAADNALTLFCSPRLKNVLRRPKENEIAMNDESCESHNCFFVIPDSHLEQYSPLVDLVVAQLLQYLSGREFGRKKLLILLDEYGSLKVDVTPLFQKYRKRNVRLIILIQALSRIDQNFSPNIRKEILSNAGINYIAEETEPDAQEYYSRKAGTKKVKHKTRDKDGNLTSYYEEDVLIFPPNAFAGLGKKAIIISNGHSMKVSKAYFFKERTFKKEKRKKG